MERIPVFFDRRMVVDIPLESPSPRKPLEVVESWLQHYPVEIHGFEPVTSGDFCLAHDPKHVEGVLALRIRNGMDTLDAEVAESLPWTTGSLLAAARHALVHGVAVSPSSGFHHAGYDFSWGFCTFNGLLVTALKLLQEGCVRRVGILDFDQHQGDGSEDIIAKLGLADGRVHHLTGKTHYTRQRDAFFTELPALLQSLDGCDLVLYQAGADPHIRDPLGGYLDNDDLRVRDQMVFESMLSREIPVAWNLAGGYQERTMADGSRSIQAVLDIHDATMEECLRTYDIPFNRRPKASQDANTS
jgi:acetoin utilization deacetylase AcuC-like enzyme